VYTVTIEWPATEKDASFADELDLVWITLYYEQAN
jgi:hypothetical protein